MSAFYGARALFIFVFSILAPLFHARFAPCANYEYNDNEKRNTAPTQIAIIAHVLRRYGISNS